MRDRDVRNAIQSALIETNAFDGVFVWGLPENYGIGSSQLAAAVIEPESSQQSDRFDGTTETGLVLSSRVTLTFFYRHEDPQLRDEGCELLVNTAAKALNGQSLAGLTMPDFTRFLSWRWLKPTAPERRIQCLFSYRYLVDGWDEFDVDP